MKWGITMLTYIIGVLLLGFCVGLVSGMFGLGGGGIIVPALLFLLPIIDVPASHLMFMAMGTSFATMIISTSASTYNHYVNKNIDFKRITFFLPILLIAVFITSQLVTSLNQNYLKLAFSLFLIYLGMKMLLKNRKKQELKIKSKRDFLYAFCIGVISTLGSISGAGLIVTYLNSTGLPLKKAIGTASFCGVFLTLFASLGFIISGFQQTNLPPYSLGFVHLPTVLVIALLVIPSSKLGVKIMLKLSDQKITLYFAVFLIVLSIYMFINALQTFF